MHCWMVFRSLEFDNESVLVGVCVGYDECGCACASICLGVCLPLTLTCSFLNPFFCFVLFLFFGHTFDPGWTCDVYYKNKRDNARDMEFWKINLFPLTYLRALLKCWICAAHSVLIIQKSIITRLEMDYSAVIIHSLLRWFIIWSDPHKVRRRGVSSSDRLTLARVR